MWPPWPEWGNWQTHSQAGPWVKRGKIVWTWQGMTPHADWQDAQLNLALWGLLLGCRSLSPNQWAGLYQRV